MSTSLDNSQMYITLLMLHGLDSLLQIHANTARTADSTWNTFMHSCNFPVHERYPTQEAAGPRIDSRTLFQPLCLHVRFTYDLEKTFS